MKKNLFHWMVAIALVATPTVFVSCSDDDSDEPVNIPDEDAITFNFMEFQTFMSSTEHPGRDGFDAARNAIKVAMYNSAADALGIANFDYRTVPLKGKAGDEAKLTNALDATYAQLKETDMQGGKMELTLRIGEQDIKKYVFDKGYKAEVTAKRDTITFENQQLNEQLYWIGNGEGKYTYTEKCATVTGTQTVYDGAVYWSGFAISGRKDNTFATLDPDQYNSVPGGGRKSDKFLVVQGAYNNYECITFAEPVKLKGMYCTNSTYAYNSMTKGDDIAGGPFEKEDWFSCNIICLGENGDTITVKEVKLAEQGYDLNHNKLIDIWHATLVNAENVKTIKFMFDGSRKNDWGLTTPAYMCVDDIIVEHYTE